MYLLVCDFQNQQLSPRSTPSTSSSPSRGKSPSVEAESRYGTLSSAGTEGSVAGRASNPGFDWRQDLLSAADSVTDAMSSLVLEYNGGTVLIELMLLHNRIQYNASTLFPDTDDDESNRVYNGLATESNTCV